MNLHSSADPKLSQAVLEEKRHARSESPPNQGLGQVGFFRLTWLLADATSLNRVLELAAPAPDPKASAAGLTLPRYELLLIKMQERIFRFASHSHREMQNPGSGT